MMFRVRQGKLQQWVLCVRTRYDAERKRGLQEVVAKFHPYADDIPADVVEALTPEERIEAEQWLKDRKAKGQQYTTSLNWRMIVRYADELSAALGDPVLAPIALETLDPAVLYGAMDRLSQALRKQGKTRPAAPKKPLETEGNLEPTPLEKAISKA